MGFNMKTTINILFILFFTIGEHKLYGQAADNTKFGENKDAGKFADIRGFKIYYESYGKGEPLLLIHGNGGSIKSFVNQIPYFSKSYRVIVPDSRAQGKSFDSRDSLSYEMMADDLDALLEKLNLKQVNVIGWSDGGINGLLLAMRHPDKVKKLAVTGANLWPDTTAVEPYIVKLSIDAADSLSKLKRTPAVQARLKLANLLAYQPHIKLEELHRIKCPSLIIGGDHDVIRPEHTLAIAKAIPHSYIWILPNSGHFTPFNHKDLFNVTIDEFFKKPYRKIEGMNMMFY